MNRYLKRILFVFSILFGMLMPLASCGEYVPNSSNKVIKPLYYGNLMYFIGQTDTYSIEGYKASIKNQLFVDSNTFFSDEGKSTAAIKKQNGQKLCDATFDYISQKNTMYIELNDSTLTEENQHLIKIPDNCYDVYVNQDDISRTYSVCFLVPYTVEHSVSFTFDNVNIQNEGDCPILLNMTPYSISIHVKGSVSLKGGTPKTPTTKNPDFKSFLSVLGYGMITYYACYASAINVYYQTHLGNNFFEEFQKANDTMFTFLKVGMDGVTSLFLGNNGIDGINGIPTIDSLGEVAIYGDGNLQLIGSNGGSGGAGSWSLMGDANGGRAGSGTYAIVARSILLAHNNTYNIKQGEGGWSGPQGGNMSGSGQSGIRFANKTTSTATCSNTKFDLPFPNYSDFQF